LLLRAQTNFLESVQSYVGCLTNQPINPSSFADDSAWHLLGVGLYHYRTGYYSEAADYCQKCADYAGLAGRKSARVVIANILLAMCDAQLGKNAEAQSHYTAAKNLVEEKLKKPLPATDGFSTWFDWIYAQILLSEVEASFNFKTNKA
jgi:tetratricopeptide (TPR) repeat protein